MIEVIVAQQQFFRNLHLSSDEVGKTKKKNDAWEPPHLLILSKDCAYYTLLKYLEPFTITLYAYISTLYIKNNAVNFYLCMCVYGRGYISRYPVNKYTIVI